MTDRSGSLHIAYLTPPDLECEDDGYDVLEPRTAEELQDEYLDEELEKRGLLKLWRST